ncbi:MAG: hypothetical protein ABIS45_04365 [Burkholderiales bacterium]
MTAFAKIAWFVGFTSVLVAAGLWYRDELNTERERERLRNVVLAEFETVKISFTSTLVYQESGADADCKTATVNRVFASHLSVTEICASVYNALLPLGWKSWSGCSVSARNRQNSSNPGQLVEQVAGFSGSKRRYENISKDYFNIRVSAQPDGREPIHFALGTAAGQNAVYNSKHDGSAYFSVSIA